MVVSPHSDCCDKFSQILHQVEAKKATVRAGNGDRDGRIHEEVEANGRFRQQDGKGEDDLRGVEACPANLPR